MDHLFSCLLFIRKCDEDELSGADKWRRGSGTCLKVVYTHTKPLSWHILKPTNSLSSYTAMIHEPACLFVTGWRQQGVPPGRNNGGRPAAQPRWELHFPQFRAAGRDLRHSTGQKWERRLSCLCPRGTCSLNFVSADVCVLTFVFTQTLTFTVWWRCHVMNAFLN